MAMRTPIVPVETRAHPVRRLLVPGVALLGLELLTLLAHERNNVPALVFLLLVSGMTFAVAVWEVYRSRQGGRQTLFCILAFGALFRALLVPINPPRLSTDVYRYVWDGRVQGAGINPYLYPPADPELAFLQDEKTYPEINRRYARTIYPPAAQVFFWLVTRLRTSVTGMKAAMAAVDFGTVLLLTGLLSQLGLPRERVLVYAWHPLPIWEFAGSGHVDGLMLFLTVAAVALFQGRRYALAGATLAGAALVKFLPFALLPALLRRGRRKLAVTMAVVAVALYLPYLWQAGSKVLGFLPQYTHEEGLAQGDGFYLLRLANAGASLVAGRTLRIPPAIFLCLLLVGYAAVAIPFTAGRYRKALEGIQLNRCDLLRSLHIITFYICVTLSSNYPWYYAWAIPWLVFVSDAPALLMTLAVFVLYRSINEPTAADTFWFHSQLFLPVLGWVVYRFVDQRRNPSPLIHEFR